MRSPVEPRNDWVVIQKIDAGVSPGGIHIPQKAYEEAPRCRVLAVGPGRVIGDGIRSPIDLSPGDIVNLWGAQVIPLPDPPDLPEDVSPNGHGLIREDGIVCIVQRAREVN